MEYRDHFRYLDSLFAMTGWQLTAKSPETFSLDYAATVLIGVCFFTYLLIFETKEQVLGLVFTILRGLYIQCGR